MEILSHNNFCFILIDYALFAPVMRCQLQKKREMESVQLPTEKDKYTAANGTLHEKFKTLILFCY